MVGIHHWKCTMGNTHPKSKLGLDVFTAQCYNMTLTDFRSTTIYFHSYCHKPLQCTVTIVNPEDLEGINKSFFCRAVTFWTMFKSQNDSVKLVLPYPQSSFPLLSPCLILTARTGQPCRKIGQRQTQRQDKFQENNSHKSEWFSKAGSSSSSTFASLALSLSDLDSQHWAAMCNVARVRATMLADLKV